jgi:hypothetical protein
MVITLKDSSDVSTDYTVTLKKGFTYKYNQDVEYVESMNGRTQAYNNGPTFDKWATTIVIQGLKDDIFTLATAFEDTIEQAILNTDSAELIFGAGIDYTNTFLCNVTNNSKPYPLTNITLAELSISVRSISSNGVQLAYRAGLSGVLPDLNYQTPVSRVLKTNNNSFVSDEFGSYGNTVTIGASSLPVKKHVFTLPFIQTEEETANIEKFYYIQRSTPFLWTGLDCLDLFGDVLIENVMITKLSSTLLKYNEWKVNLTIITNV